MDSIANNQTAMSPEATDAKASILMKAILLLNLAVDLTGACMHVGLILVTIRNKKFHGACHILIGANSGAVLMAYLLLLTPFWMVFVPGASIQLSACFALQFLPMIGSFLIYSLMPAIGLDRLLSAFCPKWYLQRNERLYPLFLLSVSAIFPILIVGMAFIKVVLANPNTQVLCTLGEILDTQALLVVFLCIFCIILSASCYVAVWIRFRMELSSGDKNVVRSWQPIFRSLCIILCVQCCGWVLGQSVFVFVYLYTELLSSLARWQINMGVMCFLSLVAATDVVVLYQTSTDYRTAFQKQFPWLLKKKGKEVVVVQMVAKSRASSLITQV